MLTKLKTNNTKKSVKGFNLIEIAIVLAVIGVIVGGIYVAASSVYENNRKQKVTTQMINIVQAIRTAYAGQASFNGAFATSDAVAAKMLPGDMVNGTAAYSPYGAVVIAGANGATTFDVEFDGLSGGSCTDMLVKTVGTSQTMVSLGTSVAKIGTTAQTVPMTVQQAAAACSAATQNVTITFSLRG